MGFKKGDPRAKEYGRLGGLSAWKKDRNKMLAIVSTGGLIGGKIGGHNCLKKRWKEDKSSMLKIARKAMIKSLISAKNHNHKNSKDMWMRSKEEVELSEKLYSLGIEFEYEKHMGYAIPDFKINNIVIEVAGIPYYKYWERMKNKYNKYIEDRLIPIIWNTSKKEIKDIPVFTSIEGVLSELSKCVRSEESGQTRWA